LVEIWSKTIFLQRPKVNTTTSKQSFAWPSRPLHVLSC